MSRSTLEQGFLTVWRVKHRDQLRPVPQYQFAKESLGRKWAFDFAWPQYRVAVELEGATWSGGRHTRGGGFQKDAEKYNAATMENWSVLRYTATDLKQRPIQVCDEVFDLLVRKGIVD